MPSHPSEDLLNRPLLRQLAGDTYFERGERYFADGHVRQLHAAADRVGARVVGTSTYRVKLWRSRSELQWSCTCPLGREAVFCKHAVAVGLAWLAAADMQEGKPAAGGARREQELRRESVERYLAGVDRERLVALVLEATDFDDILRRRLLLESIGVVRIGGKRAKASSRTPDLAAYRQLLKEAIEPGDHVDYEALPDYAQGVKEAIGPLGDLLDMKLAGPVVELAEFALVELDKACELLDGGDGSLNRVYDHLQQLHLEACRAARLDPAELAGRLLEYELEGGLGVFNNAVKTYGDVLGKKGVAAWRALLTRQWAELTDLPASKTAHGGTLPPIDHRRFQLQTLMENLAESEGDVDTLLAIKQRDLSSPQDFLSLAELCRSAGRDEEALAWAQRGLREFAVSLYTGGLRDFVVVELQRHGRHEEAVAMVWEDFCRFGNLEHFRQLKRTAEAVPGGWEPWRKKAFAHLREHIKQGKRTAKKKGWNHAPDHSALVEILLDEGNVDEAWEEARGGGCHGRLWMQLAAAREKQHPADALHVYQERLTPTIAKGGQSAYREAVDLLKRVRKLFGRLERKADFAVYCGEVRQTHRQKRSLLRLLDEAGL